jgi:hypothetical protein
MSGMTGKDQTRACRTYSSDKKHGESVLCIRGVRVTLRCEPQRREPEKAYTGRCIYESVGKMKPSRTEPIQSMIELVAKGCDRSVTLVTVWLTDVLAPEIVNEEPRVEKSGPDVHV